MIRVINSVTSQDSIRDDFFKRTLRVLRSLGYHKHMVNKGKSKIMEVLEELLNKRKRRCRTLINSRHEKTSEKDRPEEGDQEIYTSSGHRITSEE